MVRMLKIHTSKTLQNIYLKNTPKHFTFDVQVASKFLEFKL